MLQYFGTFVNIFDKNSLMELSLRPLNEFNLNTFTKIGFATSIKTQQGQLNFRWFSHRLLSECLP